MSSKKTLFPSYFLAGFECATHVNRRGAREDMVRRTQHDRFVDEDYARLLAVGIRGVRESVPWYRIQREDRLDFRPAEPFVTAGMRHEMTQIWDLFHYGFPPHLNPFEPEFVTRFADYCYAFARYLIRRTGEAGTRFYTPVNEPSFYAWAGGEVGWFAPFERGQGLELKLQLARAAIAGIEAIRAVDPGSRMVNVDPICNAVAPLDEPELAEDATRFNEFQWQTWDMISGRAWPELGGAPEYLDIVGVNYYLSGQWEHCRGTTLEYDDPRRKPFAEMLSGVARRYPGHTICITETGCWQDLRPRWVRDVVDGVLRVREAGVDVQGICLYPIVDMPDWHTGEWMKFGLWDVVPDGKVLRRVTYEPMLEEVRRSQRRLIAAGLEDESVLRAPAKTATRRVA
ncbi:MAG TPA: glycoside hydrolase [Chloroflexota bacterium]|jgi:beta-glucosidase/6-phospho-beta-glucosidase/beta-galactosidase|nr:glycoside hydrolase [Chloroflexota bacterium]